MATVPKNCPKELESFIKEGLELSDVTFHNAVSPFGAEPEHRFHTDSLKPSRRCNAWLTRAGYILEQKGQWRHIPEAHGKIGTPKVESSSVKVTTK